MSPFDKELWEVIGLLLLWVFVVGVVWWGMFSE